MPDGRLSHWEEAARPGPLVVPVWQLRDYAHPRDVLQDNRLDQACKRAVLASWASDAYAVESHPGFRWLPGTPGPVALDRILAAIRSLDEEPVEGAAAGYRLH